jgi:hypothetical protein
MKPRSPGGTTVTLNEYASAVDGIEHVVLDGMGNERLAFALRLGGPKAPERP